MSNGSYAEIVLEGKIVAVCESWSGTWQQLGRGIGARVITVRGMTIVKSATTFRDQVNERIESLANPHVPPRVTVRLYERRGGPLVQALDGCTVTNILPMGDKRYAVRLVSMG